MHGQERSYVVRPAVPSDGDALVALFARDGSPCFCRYWHFGGTNKEWEARCAFERDDNETELRTSLGSRDDGRGLVALLRDATEGDTIVGWMKLAPRASLTKLVGRVPYRGIDALEATLSIGCFLVDAAHRRHGVAGWLVDGAIAEAVRSNARVLEAYPRRSDSGGASMHDGELFTGPESIFLTRGFSLVAGGDGAAGQYPLLRREIVRA